MAERGFELFAVTADHGIHAWAPDPSELFRQAALGLWSLIVAPRNVRRERRVPVTVEADDRESLLVAWLNELLFVHEVDAFAACDATIAAWTETRVQAEIWGEALDPGRHEVVGHVKAATYHGLRIAVTDGRWDAWVVVDV